MRAIGQKARQIETQKESPEFQRAGNASRARRALEDGQYRKAVQALTSGGLVESTPEVIAEMQLKHPQDVAPFNNVSSSRSSACCS